MRFKAQKNRLQLKLLFSFIFGATILNAEPYVEAEILGQLGNNLFIVAAAQALAWDNDAGAYFPELQYNRFIDIRKTVSLLHHVFFRCNLSEPPSKITSHWYEPSIDYHKIPFNNGLKIHGYFPTEKYFAHHREKILNLFAPHPDDLKYIRTKYHWLIDHPNTVSIQLRKYFEDPNGTIFVQYGKDYVRKAMKHFSDNALFLVFSNDMNFAKENIPEEMLSHVKFIENEPHYIDLHLISLCKHNIISNSTFGWWGAWLNQNPSKKVITPERYYHPLKDKEHPTNDYFPDGWIKISAKWGGASDPSSYQ